MPTTVHIKVLPSELSNRTIIESKLLKVSGIDKSKWTDWKIRKRSIDARFRPVVYQLKVELFFKEDQKPVEPTVVLKRTSGVHVAHIIGAGPTGYFAALELLQNGIKPIIYERGKNVRERRRDLRAIQQEHVVNPDSNYCFGEGGAGTYSDGKLYTRAKKRGDVLKIGRYLVHFGAPDEILIDAHPHIGSNKLPKIIANMRASIEQAGGEVHFSSKLTDFRIENRKLAEICLNNNQWVPVDSLILATGHSARDVYQMLHHRKVRITAKPFALGVRIEHPQELIDSMQYGKAGRGEYLPAASYRLACEVDGNGVYSFCMCPGGLIVPTATAKGEIVVNGMSLSKRDSPYSNSGFVTSIDPEKLPQKFRKADVFSSLEFQKDIEQKVFRAGDGSQKAPAQRIEDFFNNRVSSDLPSSSYIPGIWSAPVHELLPKFIVKRLQAGLKIFDRRMKGYRTNEGVIVATESRTSAPVAIPRLDNGMHPEVAALFPAGEGAGYAGGIMSAAMDGIRIAQKVVQYLIP